MNNPSDGPSSRRRLFTLAAGTGAAALLAPAALAQPAGCAEDTLDRIKRTGVFNLGVRDATPPYGFKDASGEYVGFATEMAVKIYDAVNKELGGGITLNDTPVPAGPACRCCRTAPSTWRLGPASSPRPGPGWWISACRIS